VEPTTNLASTTNNLDISSKPNIAETTNPNGTSNYSINNGVTGAYDETPNKLNRKTSLYDKVINYLSLLKLSSSILI